ncbi:exo 1,3/1,4-beta-D-glucan glucohydrolase [Shewanella sp. NIFS-20-20]|uniref:glycoside hydrolase family 3 protein n=1 Tax=Shewanella sp. NIFS-20-20 TaxID=2853806 RepID=UPI00210D6954|nr:exo 1,3/1,4-beta-D-glucan glucohydrolase [Shewanella sp. NIFS-20-20]
MTTSLVLVLSLNGSQSVAAVSQAELNTTQTGTLLTNEDSDMSRSLTRWPKGISPFAFDQATEQRIETLLAQMSIEQKVAQIIQPEIRDFSIEDMRQYGFGSYLNGGGAYPDNNKEAKVQDWVNLAESLYQAAMDSSADGIAIPPLWGTDAVHGHNNVLGATLFPHNIGLGATANKELIASIAAATAKEVAATGIDWVFAPTVARASDPRWGRTYEAYGQDPQLVSAFSAAFVEGMQGSLNQDWLSAAHTVATAKHFIGDGGTWLGDDQGDTRLSEPDLIALHGQGYVAAIGAGVQTIMMSFSSWWGEKNHGNHYLMTEVLKHRMGFDGVLVGDWNGHGQLPNCTIDSCPDAINAGLDVFMVPTDAWKALYHNTVAQARDGRIGKARLDDAVRRMLRVKIRAGLFDKPSPAKRPLAGQQSLIGHQDHRAIARQAVRESLVLLKNNRNVLPLSPRSRVLVAGDGADNIGKQAGGWSVTWQGTDTLNADFPGATSIYAGIAEQVTQAGGEVILSALGQWQGRKPDVAIVVFGENPYAEGNGDLANLEYQRGNKRDLALLKSLQEQGIAVVSVFITGRPLWVNPEINASDAFVVAWLPGSEGAGVADVLFTASDAKKRHEIGGRLSFSWPASPTPSSTDKPLFELGYGLTFADATELPVLSEETLQQQQEQGRLAILDGVVKAPWQLWLGDKLDMQQLRTAQLDLASVSIRDIDKSIQQDARRIHFKQPQALVRFQADFPLDLRDYQHASAQIMMDVRLPRAPTAPLILGIGCGDDCLKTTSVSLDTLALGQWQTLTVDLGCFGLSSEQLSQVFIPLQLGSSGDWIIELANIRWQPQQPKGDVRCD